MSDTERYRLSLYEAPGRIYGWRAWVAYHLMRIGCRHPVGMVCKHRHYEYDFELRGSHAGYTSGVLHERDQQRRETVTLVPTPPDALWEAAEDMIAAYLEACEQTGWGVEKHTLDALRDALRDALAQSKEATDAEG